jgi:hypothetical protein
MPRKVIAMKHKLCVGLLLCLVSLMSAFESEAQDIEYLLKMGHYQVFRVLRFPLLSNRTRPLTDVESGGQKREKPPVSEDRIAVEIIGAAAVGTILGITGGYIGGKLYEGCSGFLCEFDGILIGWSIGYPLGSAIGVYIAGNTGNEIGSFPSTLLGSILGQLGGLGGVAIAIALAGEGEGEGEGELAVGLGGVLFFVGSPIGATIGFNLTRRYKSPPSSETALINFRDGQMRLEVPQISFYPDRYARGTFTQRVDLVKVRF